MKETNTLPTQTSQATTTVVEIERVTQEVQAMVTVAKKFPRDQATSLQNIMFACTQIKLANEALYAYPRGKTMITDASIRLAEVIAQAWGNIQYGLRELDNSDGRSTMQAYAWDLETNSRQVREFHVAHKRTSGKRTFTLNDPRDIYEMNASQGVRRMRACILAVIPSWVKEAAIEKCEETRINSMPTGVVENMIEAFSKLGVTEAQIVARLGHQMNSMLPSEINDLRKIYTSMKDGMSKAPVWFDVTLASANSIDARRIEEKAKAKAEKSTDIQNEKNDSPMRYSAEYFKNLLATCKSHDDLELLNSLLQSCEDELSKTELDEILQLVNEKKKEINQ